MPPGDTVKRDLYTLDNVPPEFKVPKTLGSSAAAERPPMSLEEYKAWCTERGLSANISEDDTVEPIVFHNPFFPGSFQGSWAISQSVRDALREPFPIPKLPPLYEIKPSPGRGLGMFATRDLAPGSDILYEHPVIVIDRMMRALPPSMSKDDVFQLVFDRLDPPQQESLMSLANCKTPEEAGPVEGIIRTNAFGLELSSGRSKAGLDLAGVLLDLSRCNHSCSPNASYKWDEPSYSMRLYATRRIAAGEEIFLIYTDSDESRAVRQKRLKLMYKFDCVCTACALPDAKAIRESDARRAVIKKWRAINTPKDLFLNWLWLPNDKTPPAETFFAPTLEVADAYVKENLSAPLSILETICGMYAALGDEQKYREWGARAIDRIRVDEKNDSRILREYLARVIDPKSILYWGEKAFLKG